MANAPSLCVFTSVLIDYRVVLVKRRAVCANWNCSISSKLATVGTPNMAAEIAVNRYTSNKLSRKGHGVAIIWFRNDLRLLDNEALYRAWISSEAVLPVYCMDPRLFGTTHNFGFPKTGELRAQFLLQSLTDLRNNLQKRGLNLFIELGKPENILPTIAKVVGAHTVFAHQETCSEELSVEKFVQKGLERVTLLPDSFPSGGSEGLKTRHPRLELIWGSTMYHLDDLPFTPMQLPDVYTQFRKAVEYQCKVRPCFKMPPSLAPPPKELTLDDADWGNIPTLNELGFKTQEQEISHYQGWILDRACYCVQQSSLGVLQFVGGETAALTRLHDYFWEKDKLRVYKETRNGMLGADYSTKFSPWLAVGSLSLRYVYEEVKRYEKNRIANDSTYWVLFELIWRDYFRFISIKYGNSIFHLEGPRRVKGVKWSQDQTLFEFWQTGKTGYPLIDASMKELMTTGFMSNRGRQIVCSFLVKDMGIDWRMGAEWFETCLLDYDPCSNYGNWTYGAGVGNDPREDRYFSIPKQARTYDPDGDYVAHWIPELAKVPKSQRHFPGNAYISPVVPLKFINTGQGKIKQNDGQGTSQLDSNKLDFRSGNKVRGIYSRLP